MRKMKFSMMCLMLSLNAFAGAGGHGGDPYETYAEKYPDQQKLQNAIDLAVQRVHSSELSERVREKIVNEIRDLEKDRKYLYIEQIIIIEQTGSDTFKLPQNAHSFLSLGAMTGENKGDAVYFSQRTLSYEVFQLSELLVHEVLHHLTSISLTKDEEFIKDTASAIMNLRATKAMSFALENGLYLGNQDVKSDQFIRYAIESVQGQKRCELQWEHKDFESVEEICRNRISSAVEEFVKTYPSVMNLAYSLLVETSVQLLFRKQIFNAAVTGNVDIQISLYRDLFLEKDYYPHSPNPFRRAFLESGLGHKFDNYVRSGMSSMCKRREGMWIRLREGCREGNHVLFKDLF